MGALNNVYMVQNHLSLLQVDKISAIWCYARLSTIEFCALVGVRVRFCDISIQLVLVWRKHFLHQRLAGGVWVPVSICASRRGWGQLNFEISHILWYEILPAEKSDNPKNAMGLMGEWQDWFIYMCTYYYYYNNNVELEKDTFFCFWWLNTKLD